MCYAVVHSGLQECLRTRSREHLNHLAILNHICHKVTQRNGGHTYRKDLCVDKTFGSIALMRLLNWSNYFNSSTYNDKKLNVDLSLHVCSMNRKEGNLTYCRQQLETFFSQTGVVEKLECNVEGLNSNVDTICAYLTMNESETDIWDKNMVRGVYETSKWMYCSPEKREAALQFTAANTSSIMNIKNFADMNVSDRDLPSFRQSVSRSMLKISEWLQPEAEKILTSNSESPLVRLVTSLDDIRLRNGQSYDTPGLKTLITPIDLAVGKLICNSINHSPDLAKSWGAYGNWCYRWGRKVVELRGETDSLQSIDIASITALIPTASPKDIDRVAAILNQHKLSTEDEEMIISHSEESSTELIESQLRSIPILSEYSSEQLQQIVEIWRQAHKSVYSYYEMAAEAYFKYLQLTTAGQEGEAATSLDKTVSSEGSNSSEDCSTVTATLRILRLIVKHALGLQDVLEDGLAATPSSPWKVSFNFFFQ